MHHSDILDVFLTVEVPFLASGLYANQDGFGKLRMQGCTLVVLFSICDLGHIVFTVTDLVFHFENILQYGFYEKTTLFSFT